MSDDVPPPSWSLLPTLVLEKIFEHVPRLLLPTMARVCTGWRYAIHRLAVKYLDVCIQTKRIEEQQLERWGWSSSTLWDHNMSTCSCIHLAFDFFTGQQEKPEFVAGTSKQLFDKSMCRYIYNPSCILGEKLFFAALDEKGEKFTLKVMNRLETESEPRVLRTPAQEEGEEITGVWDVKMVSYGDLLAILLLGKRIVSLWNGRDERWLADVDVASNLQLNRFDLIGIQDIGVSSNLMALSVDPEKLRNCLRFWRLETDQQAGTAPYFIGRVQIRKECPKDIQINEKWVVIWADKDLHYIDQSDLFTEDKSQIAASASVADSVETGNKWRKFRFEHGIYAYWYVGLQPGHSSHVAAEVYFRITFSQYTVVFRNRINNL